MVVHFFKVSLLMTLEILSNSSFFGFGLVFVKAYPKECILE